jgi:hypothetical protein
VRRRLFLQGLGFAIASGFLPRARGDASCPTGTAPPRPHDPTSTRVSTALIDEARRRALQNGKRLLLVIAPAKDERRSVRGDSLANLLQDGAPESLYPLGFTEPVVATRAEASAAGIAFDGEPWFVAVDASGAVTVAAVPLKAEREWNVSHADVAAALATAVAAPAASAHDRAGRGRATKDFWLRHAIPGSRWGYSVGCGHSEPAIRTGDDEVSSIGCGMGSMGREASRRFIRLYAGAIASRR